MACCFRSYRFEGAHREQVRHHRGEPWCQARLRDEPQFQLGQADHVVALFPVPRRNVEQVRLPGTNSNTFHQHPPVTHLVVVLHQLDDDSDVVAVVLDGDDSHDVGRVFGVRVLAVLVRQDQTRVGFVNLDRFHTSVTVVDTAFVRNLPVRHGSIETARSTTVVPKNSIIPALKLNYVRANSNKREVMQCTV
jgi:hypothetical protein